MKIARESLLTLEAYAKARPQMRAEVIAHKKKRCVRLGNHVSLYFEDVLTLRYQIQEMLRVEKIFEEEGIIAELEVYNALMPGGNNFKATMMIEYTNEVERRVALARFIGIEDRIFIQVEGHVQVYAIADEDLERETAEKTSAVHFLRFELTAVMAQALRDGAQMKVGCDHLAYSALLEKLPSETLCALRQDLE